MATTQSLRRGGGQLKDEQKRGVLCEVAGSGNWTVEIWRRDSGVGWDDYRLLLTRDGSMSADGEAFAFSAADVLNLPKLAQVLSASLVNDGWLRPNLKDDLAWLAQGLDGFLGEVES
jgi:hypothetical protein